MAATSMLATIGAAMPRRVDPPPLYRATGLIVLGLWGLFIVGSRALEPHRYPAGDIRNEPWFWLVTAGALMLLLVVALIVAVRLIVGRRR
jgi:hypothetical protein